MSGFRVVAGNGQSAPPGSIARLAFALAEHARAQGLTVVRVRCSRIRSSPSKVIMLRDRRLRDWHIRISDHYCPRKTGHEKPHFDLVSRDGKAGFDAAVGFVSRLSRGEIEWAPAERTPMRRGQLAR